MGNLIKIEKSKVYRISSSRSSFIEPIKIPNEIIFQADVSGKPTILFHRNCTRIKWFIQYRNIIHPKDLHRR